ncbi:MAG: hypothetical protein IJ137_11350 [Eubacterium sp.]|nr:hypothetical protein [Eubacterium sp.]
MSIGIFKKLNRKNPSMTFHQFLDLYSFLLSIIVESKSRILCIYYILQTYSYPAS